MSIVTTRIERQEDRIVVKRPGNEGVETMLESLPAMDLRGDRAAVLLTNAEEAIRKAYAMGRADARLEVAAVLRGLMGS